MTLGDKLANTIKELEEAKIAGAAAQANADINAIRLRKSKRLLYLDAMFANICNTIEKGKVPHVTVKAHDDKQWLRSAVKGKAEFQDLWNDFIGKFGKEKLSVNLVEEHDGCGMTDWVAVTVTPLSHKAVYRGASPTTYEQVPSTSYGKPCQK